jgi:hypothetical protein
MTRALYTCVLWLHPPAFRRRFADEMLWIFEEASESHGIFPLFTDSFLSLIRQWMLHSPIWKVALAGMGGLLELIFASYLIGGPTLLNTCRQEAPDTALSRFSGSWTGSLHSNGPSGAIQLTIVKRGNAWIGQLQLEGDDGKMHSGPAEDIRIDGDVLHFRVKAGDADMTFHGRLRDGRLQGTLEATASGRIAASPHERRKVGEGTWELIRGGSRSNLRA